MRFTIFIAFFAVAVAAAEESPRAKRGVVSLGVPAAVSYSSQLIHHAPAVPVVKYVAPVVPTVKVVRPYVAKYVVAPAVSYTKVAYPSPVFPYHGYGYGFGHYH